MAELIAIRTFMKLKVLDSIPEVESISLADLAKATGAQESLLGRFITIRESRLTDVRQQEWVVSWVRLLNRITQL